MRRTEDPCRAGWWQRNLEEVDREVARLACVCGLDILASGTIDRVLRDDMSCCRSGSELAFRKLRGLLMQHFVLRGRAAEEMGQSDTAAIEQRIVERLAQSFPDLHAKWPPG